MSPKHVDEDTVTLSQGESVCSWDGDSHVWVCKGCLLRAGVEDPDKVTESCIGRAGKHTCEFCRCVQDGSWFKHMLPCDLPERLQQELRAPKCTGCGDLSILADTEDWKSPVCYDCWVKMGEPKEEPPFRVIGRDIPQPTFKKASWDERGWHPDDEER